MRRGRAGGFQNDFTVTAAAAIPETARSRPLEIWFQDEARVGRKGTPAYVVGRQGTRPQAVQDTRPISAYIYGAICPERGLGRPS